MRHLAVLAAAFLVFTFASTVFYLAGFDSFRPDLLAVFVFYVARTRQPLAGLALSLALAVLFAAYHAPNLAIFGLLATALYLGVRATMKILNLVHPVLIGVFLVVCELGLQLLLYTSLRIALPGRLMPSSEAFALALWAAAATGIIGPFVVSCLYRLDQRLAPRRGDIFLLR
ncbi:MAG: hypothetical protein C4523_12445 [Myxococcales bacterium]|nr:MAG: hypothetical protein C4523_12445 [Myxococcales bacterium]